MEEVKSIVLEENEANEEIQIKNPAAVIEAIIFAAGYPMKYDKLAQTLNITPSEVKRYVSELAEKYNDDSHGIMILMFPETCQFCTKEQHLPYIKEALGIKRGGNLSNSSMEVLAIVAYNQPITRSFVDAVRGVDSSYAVSSLVDKGLIEATGRMDAPGRPMLYSTTDKFLRVFGISSINELPEAEILRSGEEQMEIIIPLEETEEAEESAE